MYDCLKKYTHIVGYKIQYNNYFMLNKIYKTIKFKY